MGKRAVRIEDLLALRTISDVQLSPDGARVAFVVTEVDRERDDLRSAIWIAPTDGAPFQLTRGPRRDTAPRWSPDGSLIAFLSDRAGEEPQLYLISTRGGEARKLTSLARGAGPASWSPDGRLLLFAARVDKDPAVGQEWREREKRRPRVITRAQYKADGQGYTFDAVSRIFVLALDGGEHRQLTATDSEDRAPVWSPDGRRIAFARTRLGVTDYSLADLWAMESDGSRQRRLTEGVGRVNSPSWSPDGSVIACYGTDEQRPGLGDHMYRVWLVPADGGAPRRATATYDRNVVILAPPAVTPGVEWSADARSLVAIFADAGRTHVVRVTLPDGAVRAVVGGERQVTFASAAGDRIAFSANAPDDPGEVSVCGADGSGERRLTDLNAWFAAEVELPRVERRRFEFPGATQVEGWVTLPAGTVRPAPLLVDIHGGPASYHGAAFPHAHFFRYLLAARGWTVLALNPTGSGSYGKAFGEAIRGVWGERDLPEQLRAVDELIAEGLADPERLAVFGYSYGGFMTAWMITHTDRFKAAVVGAPVVNQESFHGTSDIGMWFAPWELGGAIVSQRDTYRRLSPINYVERVTTPTLVVHGEADDRCPIGQGEELFIGLVAAGRAPVEFVRYPEASHLFFLNGRPSHRLDLSERVVEWVTRHVPSRVEEKREAVAVGSGTE